MKKTAITLIIIAAAAFAFAAQPGEDIFYNKCSLCHGTGLALNKTKSLEQWKSTVARMVKHGLDISSAEEKAVAEFLAGRK